MKLSEFFHQQSSLSNKNRVELALRLSWAVLQISSTSWLNARWTKDNILLVMDTPDNPRPYLSHRFESARRDSQCCTLTPTKSHDILEWISNVSLFDLGVFLIEVCYGRSIEDLAISTEKNENGEPFAGTALLTAMRLSKSVSGMLGMQYAQAVSACLHPPEVDPMKDDGAVGSMQFARSVMRNIIDPLTAVSQFFGRRESMSEDA